MVILLILNFVPSLIQTFAGMPHWKQMVVNQIINYFLPPLLTLRTLHKNQNCSNLIVVLID